MEKQMLIAGIKNLAGTGKSSGKPYSMFFATVLEPSLVEGPVRNAAGFEAREVECEEQVMQQLARCKFPVSVTAWLVINRDNKIKISSVRIVEAAKPVGEKTVAASA